MSAPKPQQSLRRVPLFRLRPIAWSIAIICGGLPLAAQAQETALADVPLAVLQSVQPNILITLDYSTSMNTTTDTGAQYNNNQTYRPWLFDGVLPPPHGPVRLKNAGTPGSWTTTTGSGKNQVTTTNTGLTGVCNGGTNSAGYGSPYVATGSAYKQNPSGQDWLDVICGGGGTTTVNIASMSAITPKPSTRVDCVASATSCTSDEETQNYANYIQYYQTRFKSARGAITEALGRQKYNVRVGFMPFSSTTSSTVIATANSGNFQVGAITQIRVLDAADSTGTLRTSASDRFKFYQSTLLDKTGLQGSTYTRYALDTAGKYFSMDDPYYDNPSKTGSDRGQIRSCRANYNILLTDGQWNDSYPSGSASSGRNVGNLDGSLGVPFADTYSNYLGDVAYYYYTNDLRPNLANNVPTSTKDPADWQHMVVYGVAINLFAPTAPSNTSGPTKAQIDAMFEWIALDPSTRGAFPAYLASKGPPALPALPSTPWPSSASVLDVAHAALNSRGGYFESSKQQDLTRAVIAALADAVGRSTSAPVAIDNNADQPLADGSVAYVTGYDASNWSGQLRAFEIDPATGFVKFSMTTTDPITGVQTTVPLNPIWVAGMPGNPPTQDDRVIITGNGQGGAIPFRPAQTLPDGATQLRSKFNLNNVSGPTTGDGNQVIEYLRGDRSKEGLDDLNYRERGQPNDIPLLGDIVDSGPTVNIPMEKYSEDAYPGFTAFRAAQLAKPRALFVGANDGMLHTFDAQTGKESWAYIPSFTWDCSLSGTTACPTVSATGQITNYLRDLAMAFGFEHRFFVNASPLVSDLDFSGDAGADWRTILTGSLGKGGRGVYALDVTNPFGSSATEESLTTKLLWEFPSRQSDGTAPTTYDPKNMGYVYDQIRIGHVTISGKRTWVAYVPSGFSNGTAGTGGDGKAHLFVLDAKTGALIRDIPAGNGSATDGNGANPAGMAWLSIYTYDQTHQGAGTLAYGGDQLGNLWRFDLTSENPSNWEAKKVAALKDAAGKPQPVTTPPVLYDGPDWDDLNLKSVKRTFITVGTGRYLDVTDRPGNPLPIGPNAAAKQTQSFYVFRDPFQKDQDGNPLEGNATLDPLRDYLNQYQLSPPDTNPLSGVGAERTFTLSRDLGYGISYRKGFFFDLTNDGSTIYERINVPFKVTTVAAVVPTNAPSVDPCNLRGTGSALIVPLVDITGLATGLLLNRGTTPISAGFSLGSLTITAMTIVRTADNKLVALFSTDAPLSAKDCDTLRGKGYQCQPNESVIGAEQGKASPLPPELKPARSYWRDLSIE
ncbi:MAG: PilC/PilY family type IV pilus protein [Betaproteobacteria bacterium]|nr:PilC/PilY family type IV pilus protein [Betaproteobacteria bacterium]